MAALRFPKDYINIKLKQCSNVANLRLYFPWYNLINELKIL